jgi:hypothetical protein
MPTYEPFEQFDLPQLPRFKLRVTLVKVANGMYVVMPPICQQLGDLDTSGQVAKLEADHHFEDALRKVPYDTKTRGIHLAWGIRRHKFGEWIHSINPRKVSDEYRECLDELAAEVTLFLDQVTFGKLAKHMDPAPATPKQQASSDAIPDRQAGSHVQILRPVLRGVLHINCQICGAPHRIDLDEDGIHVVLGEWNGPGGHTNE